MPGWKQQSWCRAGGGHGHPFACDCATTTGAEPLLSVAGPPVRVAGVVGRRAAAPATAHGTTTPAVGGQPPPAAVPVDARRCGLPVTAVANYSRLRRLLLRSRRLPTGTAAGCCCFRLLLPLGRALLPSLTPCHNMPRCRPMPYPAIAPACRSYGLALLTHVVGATHPAAANCVPTACCWLPRLAP